MIRYEGEAAHRDYLRAFGKEPNMDQSWWLYKYGRHCAGRTRSTMAWVNYWNTLFDSVKARKVEKQGADGQTYPGVEFTEVDKQEGSRQDNESRKPGLETGRTEEIWSPES